MLSSFYLFIYFLFVYLLCSCESCNIVRYEIKFAGQLCILVSRDNSSSELYKRKISHLAKIVRNSTFLGDNLVISIIKIPFYMSIIPSSDSLL